MGHPEIMWIRDSGENKHFVNDDIQTKYWLVGVVIKWNLTYWWSKAVNTTGCTKNCVKIVWFLWNCLIAPRRAIQGTHATMCSRPQDLASLLGGGRRELFNSKWLLFLLSCIHQTYFPYHPLGRLTVKATTMLQGPQAPWVRFKSRRRGSPVTNWYKIYSALRDPLSVIRSSPQSM